MNNILKNKAKIFVNKLPVWVQHKLVNRFRFLWNLRGINKHKYVFNTFNILPIDEKKEWIFHNVKSITLNAQVNNEFYKEHYEKHNFDASTLKKFDDLERIPIVTKDDLRNSRSSWMKYDHSKYTGNTGGTSGSPLKFNLSKEILDKEAFYITNIFQGLGCGKDKGRLVFRGLNVLKNKHIQFVLSEDAYLINLYIPFNELLPDLLDFFDKNQINYFHGYPSAIYQLALFCQKPQNGHLLEKIRKNLKGVLLGSEFPAPIYRKTIEEVFRVRSLSWYGHSEMAILAVERDSPYVYYPFHSYGYCEAIVIETGRTNLIGTSYLHHDTPFIRYDTGDSIELVSEENGLINSFKIAQGRVGEYILDSNGHPISLTALIFGRHHKAFEFADFIQVSQSMPGQAILHISLSNLSNQSNLSEIINTFDLSRVNITFKINLRNSPYRTKSGKVPLLIPSL